MPMFRSGPARYLVFVRRCTRDGVITSALAVGAGVWAIALFDAAISFVLLILAAPVPWLKAAYIASAVIGIWLTMALVATVLLAWQRYREDQNKFIKVMTGTDETNH